MKERRSNRSQDPIEATNHLLAQTKTRRSYQALSVTHPSGSCVANAPSDLDQTAISMVAPIAGEGNHTDGGLLELVTKGNPLKVWRIGLEENDVFLCAVGGPSDYPATTIRAIKRILSPASV